MTNCYKFKTSQDIEVSSNPISNWNKIPNRISHLKKWVLAYSITLNKLQHSKRSWFPFRYRFLEHLENIMAQKWSDTIQSFRLAIRRAAFRADSQQYWLTGIGLYLRATRELKTC